MYEVALSDLKQLESEIISRGSVVIRLQQLAIQKKAHEHMSPNVSAAMTAATAIAATAIDVSSLLQKLLERELTFQVAHVFRTQASCRHPSYSAHERYAATSLLDAHRRQRLVWCGNTCICCLIVLSLLSTSSSFNAFNICVPFDLSVCRQSLHAPHRPAMVCTQPTWFSNNYGKHSAGRSVKASTSVLSA